MAFTNTETQAWVDDVIAAGGTVYNGDAVDTLISELKTAGVWSKLDFLHIAKKIGSIETFQSDIKGLEGCGVTGAIFDTNTGLLGDGVDDFILPFFKPSAEVSPNFGVASSCFFVRHADTDNPFQIASKQVGSSRIGYIGTDSFNNLFYELNGVESQLSSGERPSNLGGMLLITSENAGADIKFYRNGSLVETRTGGTPDATLQEARFNGLARSTDDDGFQRVGYYAATLEVIGAGGSLTATQVADFNTAIDNYFVNADSTGTTISGITQKDGVTLVADGTYVQHLYGDDNKGTNETLLEVGTTTGGEVTFTGELPVGKVRFIRIAYQDAGRDVVKEQFFTD